MTTMRLPGARVSRTVAFHQLGYGFFRKHGDPHNHTVFLAWCDTRSQVRYYPVLADGRVSRKSVPLLKEIGPHNPIDVIYFGEQVGGISAVLWSDGTPVFPRK